MGCNNVCLSYFIRTLESRKKRLYYPWGCSEIDASILKSYVIEVERERYQCSERCSNFGRLELNTCSFMRLVLFILLEIPIQVTFIRWAFLEISGYVAFSSNHIIHLFCGSLNF